MRTERAVAAGRRRDACRGRGSAALLAGCLPPRRRPRRDPRPRLRRGGGGPGGADRRPSATPAARGGGGGPGVLVALTMAIAGLLARRHLRPGRRDRPGPGAGPRPAGRRHPAGVGGQRRAHRPARGAPRRGQPHAGAPAGGQRGRAGRARRAGARRTGRRRRPRHRSRAAGHPGQRRPEGRRGPGRRRARGGPRGRVQDGDLQLVVNALWAAGAEAVSINGQRLGPTTAIRFAGEAVLVDFRPVTSPYEISAIGDPGRAAARASSRARR